MSTFKNHAYCFQNKVNFIFVQHLDKYPIRPMEGILHISNEGLHLDVSVFKWKPRRIISCNIWHYYSAYSPRLSLHNPILCGIAQYFFDMGVKGGTFILGSFTFLFILLSYKDIFDLQFYASTNFLSTLSDNYIYITHQHT